MVLLKSTLTGIVLLVLGVALITVLGQYVTVEVRQTQRRDVEPSKKFFVEDVNSTSYTLPANVEVFGVVVANEAPSNQPGEKIRFIVLDNDNYQKWSTGAKAEYLYSTGNQGQFNYTFKTSKAGVHYFVFDDHGLSYKKYVTLSVAYNEILTSRIPDTRVVQVAWALLIVGALILIYGLVRKPQVVWARPS